MRSPRRSAVFVTIVLSAVATALPATPAHGAGCSTSSSSSCAPATPKQSGPRSLIGTPAPATVGTNLTGSGTIDLADSNGEPTAVVFWLNTCPHCQATLPGVEALSRKLGNAGQILTGAIDLGAKGADGFETPAAAVKTLKLSMPTALITRELADQWKIDSTPTAFVVDAQGTIRAVVLPSEDPAQFTKALHRALRRTH